MKKGWWIAGGIGLGCCLVLIGLVVAGLLYLGLGVNWSNLISFNQPRDLGVRYTQADLQAGREIMALDLQTLDESSPVSIEFSGEKSISGEYTSEIITAMINGATYRYYPLTNTQVLIHPDGYIESSGNIDVNKLFAWANDLAGLGGLSGIEEYSGAVGGNPSFYISGTLTVRDNNFDLNVDQAQVSFFTANAEQISTYTPVVESFVEAQVNAVPGMYIRSADFSGGQLSLDADYPAVEMTQR